MISSHNNDSTTNYQNSYRESINYLLKNPTQLGDSVTHFYPSCQPEAIRAYPQPCLPPSFLTMFSIISVVKFCTL
jgi:hypothetical protein